MGQAALRNCSALVQEGYAIDLGITFTNLTGTNLRSAWQRQKKGVPLPNSRQSNPILSRLYAPDIIGRIEEPKQGVQIFGVIPVSVFTNVAAIDEP
jgi:hypothetical protein